MTDDVAQTHSSPSPGRHFGWLVFWLLFLALLGGFAFGLLHLRTAYEAQVMKWRNTTFPLTPQGIAFRDRITGLYGKDSHDVALSLGVEFKPAPKWWPANPNHEVHLAVDPASGFEFELSFLEGALSGHRARPKIAPPPGMFLISLERIRQCIRDFAWVAWLSVVGLFIALFMAPTWRRRMAHVALALSIASLVAAELSLPPGTPLAVRFVETIAIWTWAGMIPVSIGLFLGSRPPRPWSGVPLCLRCGYNLTGNTAGRCSECGAPIPRWLQRRIDSPGAIARLEPDFEHIKDDSEKSEDSSEEKAD